MPALSRPASPGGAWRPARGRAGTAGSWNAHSIDSAVSVASRSGSRAARRHPRGLHPPRPRSQPPKPDQQVPLWAVRLKPDHLIGAGQPDPAFRTVGARLSARLSSQRSVTVRDLLPRCSNRFQSCSVRTELIGHDLLGLPMPIQQLLEKCRGRQLASVLGHISLRHFPFVIDVTSEVALDTVHRHEHFVEVPAPARRAHLAHLFLRTVATNIGPKRCYRHCQSKLAW